MLCSKNVLRLLTYNKKRKNRVYPNLLIFPKCLVVLRKECVGVGSFMFWKILPSISLCLVFRRIWPIHDMINLLYYGQWTDKRKYIPYISVTHKVLKSCGSKMATWAHVCDVHGASSLYKKTCRWSSFIYMYNIHGGSPPNQPKICSPPHPPPPHLEKPSPLDD